MNHNLVKSIHYENHTYHPIYIKLLRKFFSIPSKWEYYSQTTIILLTVHRYHPDILFGERLIRFSSL